MINLQTILSTFDFQLIPRACKVDDNRYENDAEHSWSLSYLFLYLQKDLEEEFGELDVQKILTLISIHDIGELGIGDVATWNKVQNDKEKELVVAEHELITKMRRPDLYNLYLSLEADEQCIEVKIVKSLDRIAPMLLRIYSKIGWHDISEQQHATRAKLDERQVPRHQFSKTMMGLYQEALDFAGSMKYLRE